MKRMRKCNDEIDQLAKDQALNYSLFVDLQLFLLYFNILLFGVVVLHFRRLFVIVFVCTESLTLLSDPTSRRFIGWLLIIQIYMYTNL
jgi:hypothetical protein